MARYKDKSKALQLRKLGYSYSQIRTKLNVSKSTLSNWLDKYPLSSERIRELRDRSPIRIEKYRNTMKKKREVKNELIYNKIAQDIGNISDRELFIAGFFLYWAEGGKTNRSTITLTNTDPIMIITYIRWLAFLKIPREKIRVKLHLYKDMNPAKEIIFWSKTLSLEKSQFQKSWIKDSKMSGLTYKNNFGHGTCNIIVHDTDITSYILMGIKFIGNVNSVNSLRA